MFKNTFLPCLFILLLLSIINLSYAITDYANTAITIADGFNNPYGIAVDDKHQVYFVELSGAGSVYKINTPALTPVQLHGPGAHTAALFWHNNHVYFNASSSITQIEKVLDTGGATISVFSDAAGSPLGLTLDRLDPNLFWYTNSQNEIRTWNGTSIAIQVPAAGGELRNIVQETTNKIVWATKSNNMIRRSTTLPAFENIVTGLNVPKGLAIDSQNNLYYEQEYDGGNQYYGIYKVHLASGESSPPITGTRIIEEQFSIRRVTVDQYGSVYWTDASTPGSNSNRIRVLPKLESQLFISPASINSGEVVTISLVAVNLSNVTLTNVQPDPLLITPSTSISSTILVTGPVPASVAQVLPGDSAVFTWTYTLITTGSQGQVSFASKAQATDVAAPAVSDMTPINFPLANSPAVIVDPSTALPEPFLYAINSSSLSTTSASSQHYVTLSGTAQNWTYINSSTQVTTIAATSLIGQFYVSQIYSEYSGYPVLKLSISLSGYNDWQTINFDENSDTGYYSSSFNNPTLTIAPGQSLTLTIEEINHRPIQIRFGNNEISTFGTFISGNSSTMPAGNTLPAVNRDALFLSSNFFRPLLHQHVQLTYQLKQHDHIYIKVYNILGEQVKQLLDGEQPPGRYEQLSWDGTNDNGAQLSAGLYFIQIKGQFIQEGRKVILLK